MLQVTCGDAGFECDVVFNAKTEKELETQLHGHAVEVHGFEEDDFSPELRRKIKSLIRRT